jgi:LacI family transcriptional regulator
MPRRPTIRDISRTVGVSTFTVSRALAGKDGVSAETRQRVLQAAADLEYLPNQLAAHLKDSSTTRTVGVLTASGRNQYYAMLLQAMDGVLQLNGHHAVSNDSMRGQTYSAEVERAGVEELLQQRVTAVVATYSLARDSLELLRRWNVPVVFVDSLPPDGAEGYPFVGIDNFAASSKVANYFADLGHLDTAVLVYPWEWNTRGPRQDGFVTTAENRGVRVEVVEADNSAESAEDAISELLSRDRGHRPTAVYATNIVLLQGTLKALRRAKVRIPEEISIVGFDDFDWAELLEPPVTVVDQHISEIGAAAAEMVLRVIAQPDFESISSIEPVHVSTELVIRRSCAPPPRSSLG